MSTKTKYLALVYLFKNYRKKQIILFIICTCSIVSNLFLVYQIQGLVDCIVSSESPNHFIFCLLKVGILSVLTFVFTITQTRMWHIFRHELINQMRVKMYEGILSKEIAFFDQTASGDIASAIMNDGNTIAESAGIDILMFVLNILRITIIFAIIAINNLMIGIFLIAISALYFFMIYKNYSSMSNVYKNERQEFANLNQTLIENIQASYEIEVLDKKEYFLGIFKNRIWNNYFKQLRKVITIQVKLGAINVVMNVIIPVAVLSVGAIYTYNGMLSIGTLVLFYTMVGQLIEPLNNLADFHQGRQMSIGAAERIYDYLFYSEEDSNKKILSEKIELLEININNYYWKEQTILHACNYKIESGDCVFITGESGCGKTTLLRLICNMYGIEDGEILINHQNITEFSKHSLYKSIKMLFQSPFIFEGTILDNLLIGDDYSADLIWEVLKVACLDDFVREQGLSYEIKEGGKNLSGGQRQRLCLARILLRKPDVLLLDEATSALDSVTEEKLLCNLKRFVEDNNMIMIAVSHNKGFANICNKNIQLVKYADECSSVEETK